MLAIASGEIPCSEESFLHFLNEEFLGGKTPSADELKSAPALKHIYTGGSDGYVFVLGWNEVTKTLQYNVMCIPALSPEVVSEQVRFLLTKWVS